MTASPGNVLTGLIEATQIEMVELGDNHPFAHELLLHCAMAWVSLLPGRK